VLHCRAWVFRNDNFSYIILNLKTLRSAKTLNLIQFCNYVTGRLNLSWVTLVNRQYYLCLCLCHQDPKLMVEVLLFPLMGNNIMHNLRRIMLITFCKRSNKLHRDNLTSSILHAPLLSSHQHSQYLFNHLLWRLCSKDSNPMSQSAWVWPESQQHTYSYVWSWNKLARENRHFETNQQNTWIFSSLHRAFWRFTYYHIPTNALIISFIT
jgi:hypothetical protein